MTAQFPESSCCGIRKTGCLNKSSEALAATAFTLHRKQASLWHAQSPQRKEEQILGTADVQAHGLQGGKATCTDLLVLQFSGFVHRAKLLNTTLWRHSSLMS